MSNVDPDLAVSSERQKMPVLAKVIFAILIFGLSLAFVYFTSFMLLSGWTTGFWEYVWATVLGWAIAGSIYGVTTWVERRNGGV